MRPYDPRVALLKLRVSGRGKIENREPTVVALVLWPSMKIFGPSRSAPLDPTIHLPSLMM